MLHLNIYLQSHIEHSEVSPQVKQHTIENMYSHDSMRIHNPGTMLDRMRKLALSCESDVLYVFQPTLTQKEMHFKF